jgi:hypothetical protein
MLPSEERLSDEDAGGIMFLLGQIGVRCGFDVARRLIRRWIERLAEKDGYVDIELERAAFDFIREVEVEVEEEKRREQ